MANIPISSFTAAANATGIGMSGFSLTGSNAQSMLDLAGTWNTSGTPTGLKLNVTDTASNAASLLMDLQVGGVSRFQIAKNGNPRIEGNSVDWVLDANTSANNLIFSANGVASSASFTQDGINLGLNSLGFAPSVSSAFDIFIRRDAANTLAQRNGVNAQVFRVYNTFTDASNYERVSIAWDSGNNAYRLQTENAGTGAARDLWVNSANLLYLAQGGTRRWTVNGSGHFLAFLDNTYDIGASGASRPRNIFAAGDIYTQSNTTGFYLGSAADVALLRDTANTLAQRRGTNAQAFRVYNTYTDASNGEWLGIRWSTNDMLIGVQANGTGSTNRQMHFSASSFRFFVGSGAVTRAWDILADTSLSYEGTGSGHITMKEQTAPAAPATNAVRIYAEDNGSGKTRLMALFATGVAQQIAIEP